ncbi:hypothetical protein ACXM2N_03555 [Corynebacterium sp. ZY180755]
MKLSEVKNITLGTQQIQRVWYRNNIIWQAFHTGVEEKFWPAFEWLQAHARSYFDNPYFAGPMFHFELVDGPGTYRLADSNTEAYNSYNARENQFHVVMENNASFTVTQSGRTVLRLTTTSDTIHVESTGTRGKYPLSWDAPWPGGQHLVSASFGVDWYGYRLTVMIDGVLSHAETNGGAFNLSEDVFPDDDLGDASAAWSENVHAWGWHSYWLFDKDATNFPGIVNRIGADTVIWHEYVESGPVDVLFPMGRFEAWLIGGGEGGGGTETRSGDYGTIYRLPVFTLGQQLTIGEGGDGDVYSHDAVPQPGMPTTYGDYSSVLGDTTADKAVPSVNGATYALEGIGEGGFKAYYTSTDIYVEAKPGKPGGMILAHVYGSTPAE